MSDCGSERGRAPALLMQWTDFSMDKGVRQQWVGDKDTGLRAGQGRVLCNVCVCAWSVDSVMWSE